MHILYVTGENLLETGGGYTHIHELATHFSKLGARVTVLCHGRKKDWHFADCPEVKIKSRPCRLVGKTLPIMNLRHIVLKDRPDIILERFAAFGGAGAVLSKLYKIPLVIEVNGPHVHEGRDLGQIPKAMFPFLLRWSKWQFKQAKKIFLVADKSTLAYKKKLLGSFAPKGIFVHNGARKKEEKVPAIKKQLRIPKNETLFLFIGSFKPWMGVWDLVHAIKELKERHPKVYRASTFLLIGKGEDLQRVRQYVLRNKLEKCILPGSIPFAEIDKYVLGADVGIAPFNTSYQKTMSQFGFYFSPLKLFEYMSAKLPIITTKRKEVAALLAKGSFFEEGNVQDLVKKMVAMHSSAQRQKIAAANFKRFEKQYTWEHVAKKQLLVFKKLTKPRA